MREGIVIAGMVVAVLVVSVMVYALEWVDHWRRRAEEDEAHRELVRWREWGA